MFLCYVIFGVSLLVSIEAQESKQLPYCFSRNTVLSSSNYTQSLSRVYDSPSASERVSRVWILVRTEKQLGTPTQRRHHSITGDSKRRRQVGEAQTVQRRLLTATQKDHGGKINHPICRRQSYPPSSKIKFYATPKLILHETDDFFA